MKLFTVPVATPAASAECQLQLSHRVRGQQEGDDNNSITRLENRRHDNDGGADVKQQDIESQFSVCSEKYIFNSEFTQFTVDLIERSRGTVSECLNHQVTIQRVWLAPLEKRGIIRVEGSIPAGATYAKSIFKMYCSPSGIYISISIHIWTILNLQWDLLKTHKPQHVFLHKQYVCQST